MQLRNVLASRVRALMAERATLDTQTKLAHKSSLGQSTVQRILAAEASATIDSVESIADAFGVPAIQLLSHTADDEGILNLYYRLGEGDKRRVLSFIEVCLKSDIEAQNSVNISRDKGIPQGQLGVILSAAEKPLLNSPSDGARNLHESGGRGRRKSW